MKTVSVWGWYTSAVHGTHQSPITSATGRTFDKAWIKVFQYMDYRHERLCELPRSLFWTDGDNRYQFSYLPRGRA